MQFGRDHGDLLDLINLIKPQSKRAKNKVPQFFGPTAHSLLKSFILCLLPLIA